MSYYDFRTRIDEDIDRVGREYILCKLKQKLNSCSSNTEYIPRRQYIQEPSIQSQIEQKMIESHTPIAKRKLASPPVEDVIIPPQTPSINITPQQRVEQKIIQAHNPPPESDIPVAPPPPEIEDVQVSEEPKRFVPTELSLLERLGTLRKTPKVERVNKVLEDAKKAALLRKGLEDKKQNEADKLLQEELERRRAAIKPEEDFE